MSEAKELRKYGLTVGVVLGLLSCLFWWRNIQADFYVLIASLVFLFLGLVSPRLLKPIRKVWMGLAVVLGWLTTRIILTVTFYVIITPIGIVARTLGKDFLNLRIRSGTESYWIPKEQRATHQANYEKQF